MSLHVRQSVFGFFHWSSIRSTSRLVRVAVIIAFLVAVTLTVGVIKIRTASAATCPCHVFNLTPNPGTFTETGGLEVGFKFKSSQAGYISGIRFYKTVTMVGTHTASLWNINGAQLVQATFTSESPLGWQEVTFPPVAITANTIYTASVHLSDGVYAASGGYFTSDIVSAPLTAPRDTTAADAYGNTFQGLFRGTSTPAYPTNSFNASNYWVDVSYTEALSSDPPVIASTKPNTNESSVLLGSPVTATFDQMIDASTLTPATFIVKDNNNTSVPGVITYDSQSKKVSFTANDPLVTGMTYHATLKGGSGGIKSLDGVLLASDYNWSFVAIVKDPCPCSVMDKVAPEGSTTTDESISPEIGVKIAPQQNGYISKVRFYKPITNPDTSHIANIWNNQGTKLASVTFTNESEYGWQEAKLATPLRVYAGKIYIVSYGSPSGVYQYTNGPLNTQLGDENIAMYATGDTRNAAVGSGPTNGVFNMTSNTYPSSPTTDANYYWIDAVFSTSNLTSDPLAVDVISPGDGNYGTRTDQKVEITFDKALNPSTINAANIKVYNKAGLQVASTPTYNAVRHQITLMPNSGVWLADETYTIKVATTLAASDASTLAGEYVAHFSTGNDDTATVDDGFGGPLLVITSNANAYDDYYSEILRTEGITYFDSRDITTLNASVLSTYKAVILAEMSLSQLQANLLTQWANDGGSLIAMRPDKKLAGLLGLQDAGSTRVNQYMKVDVNSAPGSGIVSDSIQFKGIADNYTINGSRMVASLYSNSATATVNPAVTTHTVGNKGGNAMAFTYDLAKSVVQLHQGNPAWAGQDRDNNTTIRGNDLFYGNMTGDAQPDWVDLTKIHIPQADEQQRLLVNMLTEATKDNMPLARFWYLPHDNKAALVLAGDDHTVPATTGTEIRLNNWLNESKKNCSVADWECIRASHYLYASSPISNDRAIQYKQLGFDIGAHISTGGNCGNFTSYANLSFQFTSNLNAFRSTFPGLPNQETSRYHCYVWSDWDSMPKVMAANDIRYSLDYVAFPGSWINGRSPLLTGSGMNMRLTDTNGGLLDVYQGVTNLDNESANPTAINALLDNAVGATGYYGIFGSHYDMSDTYDRTLLNAARSRNIPLISAEEALRWLDGRNNSQFVNYESPDKGKLAFRLRPGQGATGLRAMVPMSDGAGTLDAIESESVSATYTTKTVKGVSYAVFDAAPGEYVVTYSDYGTPVTPPADPQDSNTINPSINPSTSNNFVQNDANTKHSTSSRGSNGQQLIALEEDEGTEDGAVEGSTSNGPGKDSSSNVPSKDVDESKKGTPRSQDNTIVIWTISGVVVAAFGVIRWRLQRGVS